MAIIISGDLDFTPEQIKKKSRTIKVTDGILASVKEILKRDEFGFFNTSSKRNLDIEIVETEKLIKKLIDLKVSAISQGKKLKKRYNHIKLENRKMMEKLKPEMGL